MTVQEYLNKCKEELDSLSQTPENEERRKFLNNELYAEWMVEHDDTQDWYYRIIGRPSERTIMLQMMRHDRVDGKLICETDENGETVKIRRYAKKMEYQEPEHKASKFEFIDFPPMTESPKMDQYKYKK